MSIGMHGKTKIAILISPMPRELDMSKVANAYDLK
jgi:prolyl-tRNA editing enzyme YbaK/EbsC (Cys-tRNA(Pro) deacylase)